jgi:AhpD family alkylhydroperoxidase
MYQRMNPHQAAPELQKPMVGLTQHIAANIDPALFELIKLYASMLNECAHCIDIHSSDALKAGETRITDCQHRQGLAWCLDHPDVLVDIAAGWCNARRVDRSARGHRTESGGRRVRPGARCTTHTSSSLAVGDTPTTHHGAMSDEGRPYATAAAHYLRGRAPYSAQLAEVMEVEIGLDGSGALVDVGCGPGVLAVQLAPLFERVIGVDPEPEMLVQAKRHASRHRVAPTWIEARAEDLAVLDLPAARLVTFGQSIHWTDRERVLCLVHELVEPGGAVALISPSPEHGFPPVDPPAPPIPHERIDALLGRYLGWTRPARVDTFEASLQRSPFGASNVAFAPGRPDIVRTTDEVVSNYLSMSFAAPDRFGERLEAFVAELTAMLSDVSPTGLFHDWPGDTAVVWATKTT